MMQINPARLRSLREQKKLSRLQLEKQSGVTERTIQRLEREPQPSRKNTLNRLAKALGVEPGVLTGDLPLPEFDKASALDPERVQIGAQVVPKVRLAFDLIKRRYGVSATEIINMAPLFFALLAEGSLAWRREKIEEAEEAKSRLEEIDGFWNGGLVSGSVVMDQGIAAEENSIAKADLFGEHLFSDTDTTFIDVDSLFDPSTDNPFASYLRKLKAELDITGVVDVDSGDLMFGSPLRFPDYDICRDELNGIASGSHFAKMALETGDARLSEIPDELMGEDAGEERAKWLGDKLSDIRKDVEKEMADIIGELRTVSEGGLEERDIVERLGRLGTYREVLVRSGISDPEGDLRKRIEEGAISIEELDRLLAGMPLEEADSQKTNPAIEKGGDDQ